MFVINWIIDYCVCFAVVEKFCQGMSAYPDLYAKVKANGKVKCNW